jgi:hypothetical protein
MKCLLILLSQVQKTDFFPGRPFVGLAIIAVPVGLGLLAYCVYLILAKKGGKK